MVEIGKGRLDVHVSAPRDLAGAPRRRLAVLSVHGNVRGEAAG
jgi:hypothetical protein